MSVDEEKAFVQELLEISATTYSLSYQQILARATELVQRKDPTLIRKGAANVGYHWLRTFLERHPELKKTRAQVLQQRRARALNRDAIKDYFQFLRDLMERKKYSSIWSADESGFSQRELDKIKVKVSNFVFLESPAIILG